MEINPVVLKNKGAPIKVAVIKAAVHDRPTATVDQETGEITPGSLKTIAWEPVLADDTGETITTQEWVRFTNASLAEIQRFYGDMDKFQEASEEKPNETIAVAIAVMMGVDPADKEAMSQVHAKLLVEEFVSYQVTVMSMLSIANGVDPTKAARMIEEGRIGAQEQIEAANEAMDEVLTEMELDRQKAAQEKAEKEAAEAAEAESPDLPATNTSTPSSDGSDSGSASDDPTPSSGE